MKLYVASSWRSPDQPGVVERLRSWGHEVYDFRNPKPGEHGFHWSAIDPDWRSWNTEDHVRALQHRLAVEGYADDYNAMLWADACVLVLPCGRSAHLEAGWFRGQGKAVFALLGRRQEPELMYAMFNAIVQKVGELEPLIPRVVQPNGG